MTKDEKKIIDEAIEIDGKDILQKNEKKNKNILNIIYSL
jgi:hypothetical protein